MAQRAADLSTLGYSFGSAIVNTEGPGCSGPGKYGSLQLAAVAGLAGSRRGCRVPVDILVPRDPALINGVHAVRPFHPTVGVKVALEVRFGEGPRAVARAALHDLAGMALKLCRSHIVVGARVGIGPFRMCAAVTALAEDSAVAAAEPVQHLFG